MAGDLQFDKMSVDVSLAEEYLRTNEEEMKKIDLEVEGIKSCNIRDRSITADEYSKNLFRLSEEIEKHINLICQLEYLIRKRPIEGTKMDLQMIIGNLRNYKYLQYLKLPDPDSISKLYMRNDSPLMDLGWLAQLQSAIIIASKDVAAVCYLFTQLCNKCGLDSIYIKVSETETDVYRENKNKYRALNLGCIGVVTAKCDVDSAVAAFLASPSISHWGIRRILVQESVRDRFKSSIAWQTKQQAAQESNLNRLCTDVYTYDDKTFALEFVGDDLEGAISIEEFRTIKELMSLIETYAPFCVSLWAGDVAETNEIALGVSVPITWVNDYGAVETPLVSAAYYTQCTYESHVDKLCQLAGLRRNWAKLTPQERFAKISPYFPAADSKGTDSYTNILDSAYRVKENVMYVGTKCTVMGIRVPYDVYMGEWCDMKSVPRLLLDIFEILIFYGSGFLIGKPNDEDRSLLENLAKVGAPILTIPVSVGVTEHGLVKTPKNMIRVIHTSF